MASNDEYQTKDFWDQPINNHNNSIVEEYRKMINLGMNVKLVDIDGKLYIKPVEDNE